MREFKRGHRKRMEENSTITPEPNPTILPDENNEYWTPVSIEEAATNIPDDPDPVEPEEPQQFKVDIKVTRAIRNDIQTKVEMILAFVEFGWQAKDPICAPVLSENSSRIAEKMTNIIAKNPDMVKWFTKGGGYMDWMDLLMALMPVLKVAISHHITKTIETPGQTEPNFSQYSAA